MTYGSDRCRRKRRSEGKLTIELIDGCGDWKYWTDVFTNAALKRTFLNMIMLAISIRNLKADFWAGESWRKIVGVSAKSSQYEAISRKSIADIPTFLFTIE